MKDGWMIDRVRWVGRRSVPSTIFPEDGGIRYQWMNGHVDGHVVGL